MTTRSASSSDSSDSHPSPGPMRCMEIRGGSVAIEEELEMPGLAGWLHSAPHEGADRGGDVHYVSLCAGGYITRLVVADVSGHGARVARFSEELRVLMRKNINTADQTRLVADLNRQFSESTGQERFATAVVATYLAHDRSLSLCNAGHPRPLWYRAQARSWAPLDPRSLDDGNLPLGIDPDSSYQQFSITLAPGDALLFYTDAVTEAPDSGGRLLGEDGLLELVSRLDTVDPRLLGAGILESIRQRRGGAPPDDDLTLLALVHTSAGPRRKDVSEWFEVIAKLFGLRSF